MNNSTYEFVKKSLASVTRLGLLHSQAFLYCFECRELRRVTDFFTLSKTALLDCNHRRSVVNRKPEDVAAFETEIEKRKRRRRINVGKNNAGSQWVRVYEEDVTEDMECQTGL